MKGYRFNEGYSLFSYVCVSIYTLTYEFFIIGGTMKFTHNVLSFLIAAATGAGKSLLCCLMACKKASMLLAKRVVGITNTTLTHRSYVFSTNPYLQNHIVVHARKIPEILKTVQVFDLIERAVAVLIAKYKTLDKMNPDRLHDSFLLEFLKILEEKNNLRAPFSFLSQEDKMSLAEVAVVALDRMGVYKESFLFFSQAEKELRPEEVKPSSHKLRGKIAKKISSFIDNIDSSNNGKMTLSYAVEEYNKKLDKIFYNYFDENTITDDGYYVRDVSLDNINSDDDFFVQMFKTNDYSKDKQMSLEALCDDIFVYIGMNESIANFISNHKNVAEVFTNNTNGFYEFSFFDTMGVFHKQTDDDYEFDYFQGLTNIKKFASIIFLAPLKGDNNVEKIKRFVNEILSSINRSMTVFILRNNLNKYLTDEIDNECGVSSLYDDEVNVEEEYIKNKLNDLEEGMNKDFNPITNKYINLQINKHIVEFRKFGEYLKPLGNLVDKYLLSNVIEQVLMEFVNYSNSVNNRMLLQHDETCEPTINLNKEVLKHNFETIYLSPISDNFDKVTFVPAKVNIDANYGKVPHGNSYNALVRRLQYGGYYSSNIDESYYNSCDNIDVTFTRNINKLADCDLFYDLLNNAIEVKGIKIDPTQYMALLDKIKLNVEGMMLSKYLVYDFALQDAEKNHYSFESCFRSMLDNCYTFINSRGRKIDIDRWVDALYKVYNSAIEMTFNYYVMIV